MNAQPIGATHGVWITCLVVAICGVQTGPCVAEPGAVRDAATHEQLALQLRKTQQADPMKLLPVSQGEDPSRNQPKDILSQSDVLCFGGLATLVPKRAILQIPQALANRTQLAAGSKLMGWAEFYAQNRGWITTLEVSRSQAEGNQPLAADLTLRLKDSTALVVATFLGGPISVLPLKVPPAGKPSSPTALTERTKP